MDSTQSPQELAERFAGVFYGKANFLAFQFGGPVYLVGSMLTSHYPGDVDIRLIISREDDEVIFGKRSDDSLLWSQGKMLKHREELKQSRRLTRGYGSYLSGRHNVLRVDFQFQIGLFSSETGLPIMDDKPRIRMDTVPLEYFAAGRGDP